MRQHQTLSFGLIAIVLVALVWPHHQTKAKSTSSSADSSESSDEDAKQLRRTEISRALGLLKKHSVVGKNAKIVLKTSGKNLLVDPSERLQVVTSHASSTDTKAAASNSNALSSKKSNKLKEETNSKKAKASSAKASSAKSVTRKRASSGRTNKEMSPRTATAKPATSVSSEPSQPSVSSLSAIQKSIMDNASSKSASIVDSLMGPVMLDEITRMVTAIVRNKRAQSLTHLSDLVTETLDERFGPHWHTVSVATSANQSSANHNEVLATSTLKDNQNQLDSQTHVAIDDHRKTATFYVTYDFGRTLRVYIFK